jgi:peptide/nickel transport system substrate-binding protein
MPEHIWKGKDPATFKYTDAIGCDQYYLKDRDKTQGTWFLYEKRSDPEHGASYQISGESKPKYIIFRGFGTEEKRIMAMINHDIDILQDITPESMQILLKRDKYVKAWYPGFPWADMNDPCERGMEFNCSKPPYNEKDVRWALALATDIKAVSMATYSGMLRAAPLLVPPTDLMMKTYIKPLKGWLESFALDDGYKPFDDTFAANMVKTLTAQGQTGLPTDPAAQEDIFGIGWWKYDPAEATKLLTKHGFKQVDGKWMLPDGTPWKISINCPSGFEVESQRLAFAVADNWRKFGIDVEARGQESASFGTDQSQGNFDVGSYWPGCATIPDATSNVQQWHKRYIVPNGQPSAGAPARWSGPVNDQVSGLIDQLAQVAPDDPQVVTLMTQMCKLFVQDMAFLPMFGTSKFVPVDTYYWKGFQTVDNAFEGPWWWWSQFRYYPAHYSQTGNK